MKLCIDCYFLVHHPCGDVPLCVHKEVPVSPVDGMHFITAMIFRSCSLDAIDVPFIALCGPDAQYFQPKETT